MDGDILIAIVGSLEDIGWGNNFITEPELQMQLGTMRFHKDEIVKAHIHKIRNRQFKSISCEFHYVVRGKMRVGLFKNDKSLITKIMLTPNMFCALYNGGHSYEVVKDDTLMMEVKIGSYTNREDDKEDIV